MLYLAICFRLLYAVVMLQIVTVHIYCRSLSDLFMIHCSVQSSPQNNITLLAIMVLHMVYLCYSTRMSKDMLHCNVIIHVK